MTKSSYTSQFQEYLKSLVVSTPYDELMNNLYKLKRDINEKRNFYSGFQQLQHNSFFKAHSIEENFTKAMESMYNQAYETIIDFIKTSKLGKEQNESSPTSITTSASASSVSVSSASATASATASEFLQSAHNFLWLESVEVLDHGDETENQLEKHKELEEEKLKQQKEAEELKYQELKSKLNELFETIELEINCNSLAIFSHASHEMTILMDNTSHC